MRPGVYQALIDLANKKDVDQAVKTIKDAVHENNMNDLALTIKGYVQNEGLSK